MPQLITEASYSNTEQPKQPDRHAEIDRLVCQLHGLADDEIKVVKSGEVA
jgi:hypothetical protein